MFYNHKSNVAWLITYRRLYYGIKHLMGSPRDDLVIRTVKGEVCGTLELYPLHGKYFRYYVVAFQPCIGVI